ncbi:MAG TPA: glycosyltransferase family A protein [Candidatus Binatia bacterium]|jgi:glycosyltransferase involved in cell wall biosynthesis
MPATERSPTVSVIIPAYNTAAYIRETLDSVFRQPCPDYEAIVINDGSPDTEELERALEPYRDRIVYINQENRGPGGARNTGIRAARGRYVAFLDSDDFWEPDYLAAQLAVLEADVTVDVVYPDAIYFGDTTDNGRRFMELTPSEGEVTFESLVTQTCNVMVSVLARRDTVVRAGMFDESFKASEDFDLWLRIVKQGGRIAYNRRVLVHYRRRQGCLASDPVRMCAAIVSVLDKIEKVLPLTPREREILSRERTRFRAGLRLSRGKRAFLRGDRTTAIEELTAANAFFRSRKITLVLWLLRLAPGLLSRAYDLRDTLILGRNTKF